MSHVRPLPRSPHHTTHPDAVLALATERLRDAFRSVGFRPDMPRVTGTVSAEDVSALGAPVAELDPPLLERFVIRVGSTWGGADDLRRVVPRLLELAADHRLSIDRSLVFEQLARAGVHDWSGAETRAVREFLEAEWRRLLCSPPRPAHRAHRWLPDVRPAVGELTGFFDIWRDELRHRRFEPHHRAVAGHLVRLLIDSPIRPDFPRTLDDVFPGDRHATAALRRFLLDDVLVELLADAGRRHTGSVDDRRLRIASERLHRLRSRIRSEAVVGVTAGAAAP